MKIKKFNQFISEEISGTELVGPVGPAYGETRLQNKTRPKITCPQCKLEGSNPHNMAKYHFSNCVLISPRIPRLRKTAKRASNWMLKSPTNEIVQVSNMRNFCRDNNLNNGTMTEVALGNRKSHKGWTIISVVRGDDTDHAT